MKQFFPKVKDIPYEGSDSKNPRTQSTRGKPARSPSLNRTVNIIDAGGRKKHAA